MLIVSTGRLALAVQLYLRRDKTLQNRLHLPGSRKERTLQHSNEASCISSKVSLCLSSGIEDDGRGKM